MNLFIYPTVIGELGIAEHGGAITHLYLRREDVPASAVIKETQLLKEANRQLQEYFAGARQEFALPLEPAGTEFMVAVWQALRAIPYGETRSYKEIAQSIGRAKAVRAVGLANNRNPIPVFIPCHRVIGADGSLVGYRGGLSMKGHLLALEKQHGCL